MFTKLLTRSTPKTASRSFSTMSQEVLDQIRALGITNPNIVYNPR